MIAASVLPKPLPLPVKTRLALPIPVPVPVPVPEPIAEPPAPHLSKMKVLRAVARKSTPHLIEATFVPAGLFYLCLSLWGVGIALAAALVWSYGALGRRLIWHTGVPPILMLALVGLTARTVAAVFTGSTFIYFLMPILGTCAVAGLFLLSLLRSPLVGRLAHDFCPLTPEIAGRPSVLRLFRGLTILWAGVNLLNAGVTLLLLMSLHLKMFMAAKTLACLVITFTGVVITVSWSVRTAHAEGLLHGGPTGLALEMRL